jgi:uncharacterized protein YkwD
LRPVTGPIFETVLRARRIHMCAAVVLALFVVASPAGARSSGRTSALRALQAGVLTDINAFRRSHGLRPLHLSRALTAAARQHSTEMAARGYFSHSSANGSSFDRRIARYYPAGDSRFWAVGENLLWSSPTVDASGALQMWEDSPPHRENLLNTTWRDIGLSAVHVMSAPGAYGGHEVTIVTADFGCR